MSEPAAIPEDPASSPAAGAPHARASTALRRALLAAGLVTPSNRLTRRAVAIVCAVLVAVLVCLHVKAQSDEVKRHTDVLAQLAASKLIDARWDVAVLQSRGATAASAPLQTRDAVRIQRALDAANALARSTALRTAIRDLKNAYAEKAELVTRYQQASTDSQQALEAAMRADAAVSGLVRGAWREFPQRERLVAAENLVARVLAEAQQYQRAPTTTHRSALEAAAADLPRAHSLPRPIETGLARLESDVHQLLLLKPLEQMLGERLIVLNTAARIDDIAETFRRSLGDALTERGRYQLALSVYSALLLGLVAWAGLRIYRRYRALQEAHAEQTEQLADALTRIAALEGGADADTPGESPDSGAEIVRFVRRP